MALTAYLPATKGQVPLRTLVGLAILGSPWPGCGLVRALCIAAPSTVPGTETPTELVRGSQKGGLHQWTDLSQSGGQRSWEDTRELTTIKYSHSEWHGLFKPDDKQ